MMYTLSRPGAELPEHIFKSIDDLAEFIGFDRQRVVDMITNMQLMSEAAAFTDKNGNMWELWFGMR